MPRKNPETKFKERVLRDLKTLRNAWFYKTQERSRNGILDITMCVRGKFVSIELKKDITCKPTKLQIHTGKKIVEAGGVVFYASPEVWDIVFLEIQGIDGGMLAPPGTF